MKEGGKGGSTKKEKAKIRCGEGVNFLIVCVCVCVCVCVLLTGVDTSPESGLWSTERGVRVAPRSENWDEWDLGKLPLRVFTPEELVEREVPRVHYYISGLCMKGGCWLCCRNVSPVCAETLTTGRVVRVTVNWA